MSATRQGRTSAGDLEPAAGLSARVQAARSQTRRGGQRGTQPGAHRAGTRFSIE